METIKYDAPYVAPISLEVSHADGCYIFDSKGNKYLDFVSGIGVTNFGHQHPKLTNALKEQLSKIAIAPRLFHNAPLSKLLETTCLLTGLDSGIPMNSGAEAVETAIKVLRKWGYTVKGIPKDQATILVSDNSFHGRTVTTISPSTTRQYKEHFGPLTPGFQSIPYNNPQALEQAITKHTAAFIVEPIQGEAGVQIPDPDYLNICSKICKKHHVLFILDEIQTGMGRTGKPFAYMHNDIQPDGILLGKALGGGLLPISLFLGKKEIMNTLSPGDHGSTFGGNPLAASVACAALSVMNTEQLSEQAAKLGDYFLKKLMGINTPLIKQVRGKGLLTAIEFNVQLVNVNDIFHKLKALGLLTLVTQSKIIRLLPPLTITQERIDDALTILSAVINEFTSKKEPE